jgi:hypothetical protein
MPGPSGRPGAPAPVPTPALVSSSLDCDADASRWTLLATADSWTGGGLSAWSQDLVYIEQHDVVAVASAPTPTEEELRLELGIVSDWRAQDDDSSTIFTCADTPIVVFTLLSLEQEPVECWVTGPLQLELSEELGCYSLNLPVSR